MPHVHVIALILCTLLSGLQPVAWSAEPVIPTAFGESTLPRIGYIPIDGMIDRGKAAYLRRALDAATAAKVDVVVIHLTTNGGELGAALAMANDLLSMPEDGPRVIAFIDEKAWSAGAMIAYSTSKIYVSDRAKIGDIGVITQGSDGKIEYLPEKVNTAVRAILRSIAQKRGWTEAKLVKMTALDQDLYRFDLKHGQAFVIEDDLPKFLADHPDLTTDKKVLISGHDRLLSFTGQEAVQEGMATALVNDRPALYKLLGSASAAVVDLSPTEVEQVSWMLSGWASLMAAGAVLFLILEFKAPMGIWVVLAAICGIAYFVCQFYMDLANYIDVVLVLVGLTCIVVELFVFHTGGFLALAGLVIGMGGLVLSFMPSSEQFHPESPNWAPDLVSALGSSMLSFIAAAAGVVIVVLYLPKSRLFRRMAVTAEVQGTSQSSVPTGEGAGNDLLGKRGHARTELRPSGFVAIVNRDISATSEHGEFIAAQAEVEVVAVRFGEVIVRQTAPAVPPAAAPTP